MRRCRTRSSAKAKGGAVLHIPTVLGAVVVIYNLPDVRQPLKLSGDVIAGDLQGQITKWNDARIASLNAGVEAPGARHPRRASIGRPRHDVRVHRLPRRRVSPAWATRPGKGKELQWPVGLGAQGQRGRRGQVKQTPGAIGYVELAYANQNKLPTAARRRTRPASSSRRRIESVTAAAAGAVAKLPPNTDYRVSIVNAPGAGAYPISSFTWIIAVPAAGGCGEGKEAGRLPALGADRRGGVGGGARLRAAPEAMRTALVSKLDSIQ